MRLFMCVYVFLIGASNVYYDSAMMLVRAPYSEKMYCLQTCSSDLTTDNSFCVLIAPLKIFCEEYIFSIKKRKKTLTICNFKIMISHP